MTFVATRLRRAKKDAYRFEGVNSREELLRNQEAQNSRQAAGLTKACTSQWLAEVSPETLTGCSGSAAVWVRVTHSQGLVVSTGTGAGTG
jgi:hypothetical protein